MPLQRTAFTALLPALLLGAFSACATDRHPEEQVAATDTLAQVHPTPATAAGLPPSTPGYTYTDPEGRTALTLLVQPGQRVSLTLLDTAAMAIPIPQAHDRARGVARDVWTQIGSPVEADTVSVAFTDREGDDRTTREFFFYASDLKAAP